MAVAAQRLPYVSSRRSHRGWKTAVIFTAPALILFTLFIVWPVIEAGSTSVYNWNGLGAPRADKFLGFGNFEQLFGNRTFIRALGNTGLILASALLIQLPMALGIAQLVANRRWGSVAFRLIFFMPFILADVAAGLIFRFVFDGDVGLVTQVSLLLGGGEVHLLSDKNLAVTTIMFVATWKYFGFHMMLYVAGMQAIDRNLYEAASIDGASPWQQFMARHPAGDRLHDPALRVLRRPRLSAVLRPGGAADGRGTLQFLPHHRVVPLLFRNCPHARRLWQRRGRDPVRHLRDRGPRLPEMGYAS